MDFGAWKREIILLVLVIAGVMIWRSLQPAGEIETVELSVSVIPAPVSLESFPDSYQIGSKSAIYYVDDASKSVATYFKEYLQDEGKNIPIKTLDPGQEPDGRIVFRIDNTIEAPEAYQLGVGPDGIEVSASTAAGLFYGAQTLRQLQSEDFRWPGVSINDQPAFAWRGMLLDCCRHFMEPDFVKRYIDLLAYHKMNVLHWHLTEDQGWRVEIDAYPKLTEVGAWRINPDGKRYGGFYSKEQIRDIVAYAAERHVMVVPEIEMPGHSQAALAAYPELSCTGGPFEVWNDWGVSKEIYCAGNEQTFEFLETVLTEVMELFPSPYIHIGGDEAPVTRWEQCEKCQARIVNRDLHDAHSLQAYMLSRINDFLQAKGKTMVGWDEIADQALPEGAVVQSWRGMEGAVKAIEAGHQTIVSPTSHAYFDYDLDAIKLEKVYAFNPVPEGMSADLVMGGSCNMWSERAPQHTVDSKVFPRILAMSEVLWTGPGKDYKEFHNRVQNHYVKLEALGVKYGAEDVPFRISSKASPEGWVDIEFLPSSENLSVYFGQGDYSPDLSDVQFEEGAHLSLLDGDHTISARAFRNEKPYGETISQDFRIGKSTGKMPTLQSPNHEAYPGSGTGSLTDGRLGSERFRDGNWQGWWGPDLVATIDLGEALQADSVLTGFYQYTNSWIFLPRSVAVYGGVQPDEMKLLARRDDVTDPHRRGQFREDVLLTFMPQTLRYIRIEAENFGPVPDWHEAAGAASWLFVDEITVR